MGFKYTEDELVTAFHEVHKYRYRYPPFPEFFTVQSIITIICPEHGPFKQCIFNHKRGQGCPKCSAIKIKDINIKRRLGRNIWIQRFESVHGKGTYDYSRLPDNVNRNIKVEIICHEHNISFFQTPDKHFRFKQGCPECGIKKNSENRNKKLITRREYENKARSIHGLAFSYSELLQEFSLFDSIIIICNAHSHAFFCNAQEHLKGKGCPNTQT